MIENIRIKSTDPFNNEIKTIEFGRVNTIIGPKGGGKSTLFDLLAGLPKHTVLSTVEDALKNHKIEIVSATIDGELYPFNGLNKLKIKNKDTWYENRNDVIYQDDPIKKNLSASQSFDKAKMDFAKQLTLESKDPIKFIDKMKELYDAIHKIALKDGECINWANALDMADPSADDEKIIFDLNYSSKQIEHTIKSAIEEIRDIADSMKAKVNYFKNLKIKFEEISNDSIYSPEFIAEMISNAMIAIDSLTKNMGPINNEYARLSRVLNAVTSFENAYRNEVSVIKRATENTSVITAYESASKEHFRAMAELLKNASHAFDEIINAKIELNLSAKIPSENMLELSIEEVITITEDEKYELLKIVLYNAKKVQEDVSNWIDAARNNGDKGFKRESVLNHLASKIVKDKIRVLADGKDYETMSLGQKSIYGIRYKFNHAKGKPIFLDQPEDNLDNHTIATNILDLINQKDEQVFIVTHNANIGILSKPDRVIVANFKDDENHQNIDQYLIGSIKAEANDSDSAHYLEGGLQYIESRLEIIKGEK